MPPPFAFDFRNPDYVAVFRWRIERLAKLRANPDLLPGLRAYYRDHPADFIEDWGVTYDPRLVERGLPAVIPLILFPRQRELIEWLMGLWRSSQSGLCDKSRDMGVSVIATSLSVTLALFHDNLAIGFGSRKEDLVDRAGDPDIGINHGQTPSPFKAALTTAELAYHRRKAAEYLGVVSPPF